MFNKEMGLQFFIKSRGLSFLGIIEIIPCLWVIDSLCISIPNRKLLYRKIFKLFQKNLKNSDVKPSEPGLLLFLMLRSAIDISSNSNGCSKSAFAR